MDLSSSLNTSSRYYCISKHGSRSAMRQKQKCRLIPLTELQNQNSCSCILLLLPWTNLQTFPKSVHRIQVSCKTPYYQTHLLLRLCFCRRRYSVGQLQNNLRVAEYLPLRNANYWKQIFHKRQSLKHNKQHKKKALATSLFPQRVAQVLFLNLPLSRSYQFLKIQAPTSNPAQYQQFSQLNP